MSVQSEIDRIKSNMAGAYSAVSDMGGDVSEPQNIAGLEAAIRSIPSGGGIVPTLLTITMPALKTVYYSGEQFDSTGMEVTVKFSNNRVIPVPLDWLTMSPDGALQDGLTGITVSLIWGGTVISAIQPVSVKANRVFGVMWNYANSSPSLTRLTTDNDPYHLVTESFNTEPIPESDDQAGSSPFDTVLPWRDMEEYNIINNAVRYKKGQSGFSRNAYDTVVYIPEFWYRCIDADDKRYWYVCAKERDGFARHPGSNRYIGKYCINNQYVTCSGSIARLKGAATSTIRTNLRSIAGTKWHLMSYDTYCAVALLYLVEFANLDVQATIGIGSGGVGTNGKTDDLTYHTGQIDDNVLYRGIEGLWNNGRVGVADGLFIDTSTNKIYVCVDPTLFNNTGKGYTDTGAVFTRGGGYIDRIKYIANAAWTFIPDMSSKGSEGQFTTDYCYGSTMKGAARLSRDDYEMAGFFYFDTYGDFSPYNSSEVTRAMFVP